MTSTPLSSEEVQEIISSGLNHVQVAMNHFSPDCHDVIKRQFVLGIQYEMVRMKIIKL